MTVNVTNTMQRRLGWLTFWLAIVSFSCGLIGFSRVDALLPVDETAGVLDDIYRAIRILRLGVPTTHGDIFLEVGRWIGVLFLFSIVVTFLVPRIEYFWRRLRARTSSKHTVLIGSGPRALAHLADLSHSERILMSDTPDLDPHEFEESARGRTPRYLAGDIESGAHLQSLAVHKAKRLIIAAQNDALNLSVAWRALRLLDKQPRPAPLPVFTHIEQFSQIDQFIEALPNSRHAIVRPFSLPVLASRQLSAQHPFVLTGWYGNVDQPQWLLFGFDRYAEALVLHALKLRPDVANNGIRIRVIVDSADTVQQQFLGRFSGARPQMSQLEFVAPSDFRLARPQDFDTVGSAQSLLRQTAIFVFSTSDSEAYATARQLRLQSQIQSSWRVPIFVRLDDIDRFEAGLKPLHTTKRGDEVVEAFGVSRFLSRTQGFNDWQEKIAEQIHDDYRHQYGTASGRSAEAFDPASDWTSLTEQMRETNRRAVEHFPVNLSLAGYRYCGGEPTLARAINLGETLRNQMARREHASWSADKRVNGWQYDDIRDDRRLRHNCLIPFDQLADEIRKDISQHDAMSTLLLKGDAATATLLPELRIGLLTTSRMHPEAAAALPCRLDEALTRFIANDSIAVDEISPFTVRIYLAAPVDTEPDLLSMLIKAIEQYVKGDGQQRARDIRFCYVTAPGAADAAGTQSTQTRRRRVANTDMLVSARAVSYWIDLPGHGASEDMCAHYLARACHASFRCQNATWEPLTGLIDEPGKMPLLAPVWPFHPDHAGSSDPIGVSH